MDLTTRMYIDALARVDDMDDFELAKWYAKAITQFATLALWNRRIDQGDTGPDQIEIRQRWRDAAADLFIAIENRAHRDQLLIAVHAEVHR